ncbi:MAG: cupin domain-containing protein [Gaiellaceae bacterium]
MSLDRTQLPLAHWDDVEPSHRTAGHIAGRWRALGDAAGSVGIGLNRIGVEPGCWSTPAHAHGRSEEIFVVLGGGGLSWQDGKTYAVEAGDVLVHRAHGEAHTLLAGEDGLDVLAFGQRVGVEACHLPRAGVSWLGVRWVSAGGDHPWQREAAIGPPELPEPGERPLGIARMRTVPPASRQGATVARSSRDLGVAIGSRTTGVKLYEVEPGMLAAPPHCHSAEEELFVVLEGDGTLLLGDLEAPIVAGHVVARPPGSGVAHAFAAGEKGLSLLAYGTREPNDICFFPRSGKVALRGVGLIGRVERLGFWDGED